MKVLDRLKSDRCTFCDTPLIDQKVYTVRNEMSAGIASAFNSTECELYDAVDCPRCGKQHILGRRLRKNEEYIEIKENQNNERSTEEEREVQEEVHEEPQDADIRIE